MCEMPTVYKCDHPVARKAHKCYECHGTIQIGEKYHKHHGIWDGHAADYKVCNECEELRKKADEGISHTEELTPFGGLYETVFESLDSSFIVPYLNNARARHAVIPEWQTKCETELLAKSKFQN
jgi:hypothetical protein